MPVNISSAFVISIFLIPASIFVIGAIKYFRNQIIKYKMQIQQNESALVVQ